MAKSDAVFVYVGTFPSEVAARERRRGRENLHAAGAVGTYDASVVTKDPDGKVHVDKDEPRPVTALGRSSGWALVGIIFPPPLVVGAAVGATVAE